jgi:hypothetical protein
MKVRMTAADTFHTGHGFISGQLGFVADSLDGGFMSASNLWLIVLYLSLFL